MTQTLLVFAGALLLAVSVATLLVAVRTLRTARRYVDLAEERLELMREGQDRLLAHMEEQRRVIEEERKDAGLDVRTREGAGHRMVRAKLVRRVSSGAGGQPGAGQGSPANDPPAEAPENRGRLEETPREEPPKARKAQRPAGLPETRSSGAPEPPKEEERPRRAVVRPHPDDDVKPGSTLAGQVRSSGGSPIRMFRVFYDRYLDNYEGYVKLAERIHQTRTEGERVPGSRAEREWKERLRRVNDGIERTTARLDILEHSNPELASDDRVSRRAAVARSHAGISKGI